MADIPAEAVKASLIMTADDMWADWKRGGKVVVQVVADDAAEAIVRALAAHAGVGSPASCPSAAPESTQSPETTSVAPVYRPGVERPAETLSAPHGEDAHPHANEHGSEHADLRRRYADALSRSLTPQRGMADHLDAVLAVRDDELSRALRVADYHAGQHQQAEERADRMAEMVIEKDREATQWADWLHQAEATIARVRELADRLCQEPHPAHDHVCPDGLRAELLAALDGAGAVSEEQTEPVRHLGGNAEDCPACDITTLTYPFLCPGEEQTGGGNG